MFPYRAKYTESEYYIKNNDLLYKINQNTKILSNIWKFSKKRNQTNNFLFCIMYKLHNSYFVSFGKFVILDFAVRCTLKTNTVTAGNSGHHFFDWPPLLNFVETKETGHRHMAARHFLFIQLSYENRTVSQKHEST